jgi:hypothetical protein
MKVSGEMRFFKTSEKQNSLCFGLKASGQEIGFLRKGAGKLGIHL